jgi:hypothetical protein
LPEAAKQYGNRIGKMNYSEQVFAENPEQKSNSAASNLFPVQNICKRKPKQKITAQNVC